MRKVLVTGGCGYIGSHTVVDLIENGCKVIVVDNLSRSDRSVINRIKKITGKDVAFYETDLTDLPATRQIFEENKDIDGIIHFAAYKMVGESVNEPLLYFKNNLDSLFNILSCTIDYKVQGFIFSSSCSVYGNAKELPVKEETHWQEAESPYGRTKQMGEQVIQDVIKGKADFSAVLLRYFNPVGAHDSADIGEQPIGKPENLVPYITQSAIGLRGQLTVFGGDYPTRDGTCIRDYIHVMDIANAHTKALQYILDGKNETSCEVFNLGTGNGVTVKEVIEAFEKVTKQKLNYKIGPRRPGDVVAVYANNEKAEKNLGWKPLRGLDEMMLTAWNWEQRLNRQN